jgi:hypothetical protein
MTQADVKAAVVAAQGSVNEAFWAHQDEPLGDELMDIELLLNDMVTKLNQDDLESRSAEFAASASAMKDGVLPKIKQLDHSVAKMVDVDEKVKTALSDLLKLSSSVSFFKIPSL